MTEKEAIKLLKSEKEIVALDSTSYELLLWLGLDLLRKGIVSIAKVTKGFKD